jgi:hypothetical protein
MKNKMTFFAFVLSMAIAIPTFAQYTPATDTVAKPDMKQQDMLSKMGKPTFSAKSGDLLFSIWIISQEEHKKMMSEMSEKGMDMDMKGKKDMGMKKDTSSMKDKGMQMDNATKEAMMAGTHHMMVEVKNNVAGKATNAISAKVEIVSPTNKNSTVDLRMPMMDHFGSGLTLDEKGEYQLTVSVTVGDIAKTMKLKYTVM